MYIGCLKMKIIVKRNTYRYLNNILFPLNNEKYITTFNKYYFNGMMLETLAAFFVLRDDETYKNLPSNL